jgi:hypothetical protein
VPWSAACGTLAVVRDVDLLPAGRRSSDRTAGKTTTLMTLAGELPASPAMSSQR